MKSAKQEVNEIFAIADKEERKKRILSERLKLMEIELLALVQDCEHLGYSVHIDSETGLFRDVASDMNVELTTNITITASKTKMETL